MAHGDKPNSKASDISSNKIPNASNNSTKSEGCVLGFGCTNGDALLWPGGQQVVS
jgi:hypothetical protein